MAKTICTKNATHVTVDPRKCKDFLQFKATSAWLNFPEELRHRSFDSFKHDLEEMIISERIHVFEVYDLSCLDQVIDNKRNLLNDTLS